MIDQLTQFLVELIHNLPLFSVYLAFFLIAYLENLIPPMPGDVLVAFAGYLAAEGTIQLLPVYLLTTFASVIGFMSMYAIGYYWGYQMKANPYGAARFINYVIDRRYINRARRWMKRWGQGVILANRFLAGTRSVISLTAGISHTPRIRTVISSSVSSLLWNAILLAFGWIVHENLQLIGHYLSVYSWIILALLVLFVLGTIVYRKWMK